MFSWENVKGTLAHIFPFRRGGDKVKTSAQGGFHSRFVQDTWFPTTDFISSSNMLPALMNVEALMDCDRQTYKKDEGNLCIMLDQIHVLMLKESNTQRKDH